MHTVCKSGLSVLSLVDDSMRFLQLLILCPSLHRGLRKFGKKKKTGSDLRDGQHRHRLTGKI